MTNLAYANQITTVPFAADRPMKEFSIEDLFGFKIKKAININGFESPGLLTPQINPNYKFPFEQTVLMLMAMQDGDNIYLHGHSGTGKTELVKQVAARLNYNVVQVNFDGHLLRSDLLGEIKIINGETQFRHGLIPYAFQEPGTILLLDEVDAVAPETAFVLQRAVSEDRTLLMLETNELFRLHPQNLIMATANTRGAGDESGMYAAGTNVQNFSFLNRWQTVIEVDYLSEKDELAVLKEMFPAVDNDFISGVAKTMSMVRTSFKGGQVSTPLTTRDSINWVKKLTKSSAPMRMAKYSFLNRMTREDAIAVANVIARNFKLPENDDKTFLVQK